MVNMALRRLGPIPQSEDLFLLFFFPFPRVQTMNLGRRCRHPRPPGIYMGKGSNQRECSVRIRVASLVDK
jgi:hypothetical protein